MLQKFIPRNAAIFAERFDGRQEQIDRWHIRVSEYKGQKYYWLPKGDWAEETLDLGDWIFDSPDDWDDNHFYCCLSDKDFKEQYMRCD